MHFFISDIGLLTFIAYGYAAFDSIDVSYWSDLNVLSTYASQRYMLQVVFCLCHFISDIFVGRRRSVAKIVLILSALQNSVLILVSFVGVTVLLDTLIYQGAFFKDFSWRMI